MDNLGHLNRLKVLDLSKNQITKISDIDKMRNLRKVELEGNMIQNFSHTQISDFLDEINLANNPISHEHSIRGSLRVFLNPIIQKVE